LLVLFLFLHQDIRRGLNSVSRIIRDHGISGVIGPVLELVDCEEKFFTAVEVTAANRYRIILPF
jgi:structural maintenance of chromosome 3 (chondroitin sulfate proteoglycan 6)